MSIVVDPQAIYAALTVVVSVGTTAGVMALRYGRKLAPLIRVMAQFRDDWQGEPERPGYDRRPGMAERTQATERTTAELAGHVASLAETMAQIQGELIANGGGSLRDQVRRIEQAQRAVLTALPGAAPPLPLPAAELAALALGSERLRTSQAA